MTSLNLFKKFFAMQFHLLFALVLYFHQVAVPQAVAQDSIVSDNPNLSVDQNRDVENAIINKKIDEDGAVIEPPACSDTSDVSNYIQEQRDRYFGSYRQSFENQMEAQRAQMNAQTRSLYGTFAFVGTHAGDMGGETQDPAQLQADINNAEALLAQRADALSAAQSNLETCLGTSNAPDPNCTAERSAVSIARNEYNSADLAWSQLKQSQSSNTSMADSVDGSASDDQLMQNQREMEEAQANYNNLVNNRTSAIQTCQNNGGTNCEQTVDNQIDIARQEARQANARRDNEALAGKAVVEGARASQAGSDASANQLEAQYNSYISSIDAYIQNAKDLEATAIQEYRNQETTHADNSDYDVFQAIMGQFESTFDQTINRRLIHKNLAMSGTAAAGLNHLNCTEITTIEGVPGNTGPQGGKAVEVASLRLFRAASAIYLASQINATSTHGDAISNCILKCEPLVNINTYDRTKPMKNQIIAYKGEYHTPECPFIPQGSTSEFPGYFSQDRNSSEDKDEQIAAIERAANTYQKLVETTELKRASMQTALEMYTKAWEVSLQEWQDKMARVGAAQASLDQAQAMLSSTNKSINMTALAIIAAIALVAACCIPTPTPACCPYAVALLAALLILMALLQGDKSNYEAEVAKWQKELRRAQTHAMLDCAFPGYDTTYNQWNRNMQPDPVLRGQTLGELAYTPAPTKEEYNFFNKLSTKVAQTKVAPMCEGIDLQLAKDFFSSTGHQLLGMLINNAHAQTAEDLASGNALGVRGNEDVADKSQQAGKTNTALFDLFLGLKLSALKIQTYNPMDDGLLELRQNPVQVTHLRPQKVEDLGTYLFDLVELRRLQQANAMNFAPPNPNGTSDETELYRPTNTGFPQVETRHFYIQSVIWQLQDLIASLTGALGANCGVLGPAGASVDLSQGPDQKDNSGNITSSSLCDQRNYYATLLKKARKKMALGVTGVDNGLNLQKPKSGVCMKQQGSEFVLDKQCECRITNTCAKFEYPQFAGINTTATGESRLVVDDANALLSGDTAKADGIAAELSGKSGAIRDRIRKLNQNFNKAQQEAKKKNNNKFNLTGKKASLIKNYADTTNSANSNSGYFGFLNENGNSAPGGLTDDQKNKLNAIADANDARNKELESLRSQLKQQGVIETGVNSGRKDQDAASMGLDFSFGDGKKGLSDASKLKALKALNEQEKEQQEAIDKSYQSFQKEQFRKSRNFKSGNGIHDNSSRSIFKIISKRYKETAFPILLDVKVEHR